MFAEYLVVLDYCFTLRCHSLYFYFVKIQFVRCALLRAGFASLTRRTTQNPPNARGVLILAKQQNKRKVKPSFYFALGAIRTRDLSLKRGVLYLLSYKRLLAIHFVSDFNIARTFFIVNNFFKIYISYSLLI